jgi:hypothetical protein
MKNIKIFLNPINQSVNITRQNKNNKKMANLSEIFLKQETLETLLNTVKAKGLKGVSLTISMNDEANDYGQNVQSYVSQTKEDREAKKPKYWTGSGKVFWSDGKPAMVVEKKQANQSKPEYAEKETNALPF